MLILLTLLILSLPSGVAHRSVVGRSETHRGGAAEGTHGFFLCSDDTGGASCGRNLTAEEQQKAHTCVPSAAEEQQKARTA